MIALPRCKANDRLMSACCCRAARTATSAFMEQIIYSFSISYSHLGVNDAAPAAAAARCLVDGGTTSTAVRSFRTRPTSLSAMPMLPTITSYSTGYSTHEESKGAMNCYFARQVEDWGGGLFGNGAQESILFGAPRLRMQPAALCSCALSCRS
jgi:hypothetical protein